MIEAQTYIDWPSGERSRSPDGRTEAGWGTCVRNCQEDCAESQILPRVGLDF